MLKLSISDVLFYMRMNYYDMKIFLVVYLYNMVF